MKAASAMTELTRVEADSRWRRAEMFMVLRNVVNKHRV
jgi:hypothetical protein